jgi:hypothetical protein
MRRLLLVLSLMAVVAMVMAAMATPALSKSTCEGDPLSGGCHGGSGSRTGGGGGFYSYDCDLATGCTQVIAGGNGGPSGGSGFHYKGP